MLNYENLSDVEFENLCQDIMEKKLNTRLHRFAQGRDGGIDLTDDVSTKNIVVQVKHYAKSPVKSLIANLKNEVPKVQNLKPSKYYVCCSKELSPDKVNEIYQMFSSYMSSPANVIHLTEIDDFLKDKENIDILKKNYKLWLDSTGILEEVFNDQIFVDCESLLANIEKERRLFVPTRAYVEGRRCLDSNHVLFIVGNPGVGKTLTSKMLALSYAAEGYRIRYTTDSSDLLALKSSLSKDKDRKEVVLVDDCLGQAYFKMKEGQARNLLSLIRYIKMSLNKRMILNSRITILQEAKEQSEDLITSEDSGEYQLHTIDMDKMSVLDKAKILYNHLYFAVDEDYFDEVRKDRRYMEIITHPNYNPRVIEHVCNPRYYKEAGKKGYYDFIMKCLNSPDTIWRNEYEYRLTEEDRILLTTLYSFSEHGAETGRVKEVFYKRLGRSGTTDVFEASLRRLLEGFIRRYVRRGRDMIEMVNPSVNDFLDGLMKANEPLKREIIENAVYLQQVRRMTSVGEFDKWLEEVLRKHELDTYKLPEDLNRAGFITDHLNRFQIEDAYYKKDVEEFFSGYVDFSRCPELGWHAFGIFEKMLANPKMVQFYDLAECANHKMHIEAILGGMTLREQVHFIENIEPLIEPSLRPAFIDRINAYILECLEEEVYVNEMSELDADIYDFIERLEEEEGFLECMDEFTEMEVTDEVETYVSNMVMEDLISLLSELPWDSSELQNYIKDKGVTVTGVEYRVQDYIYSHRGGDDLKEKVEEDYTGVDDMFIKRN